VSSHGDNLLQPGGRPSGLVSVAKQAFSKKIGRGLGPLQGPHPNSSFLKLLEGGDHVTMTGHARAGMGHRS
jgi:hypothetical protein